MRAPADARSARRSPPSFEPWRAEGRSARSLPWNIPHETATHTFPDQLRGRAGQEGRCIHEARCLRRDAQLAADSAQTRASLLAGRDRDPRQRIAPRCGPSRGVCKGASCPPPPSPTCAQRVCVRTPLRKQDTSITAVMDARTMTQI